MNMTILKAAVCIVVSYLLGSVSFGILIGKRAGHDIRNEGSRNTGASNVLRSVGLKAAALTFLGDALKACVAVLMGRYLMGINGAMLAGLFVVIGHNWPVFFSFRGGKGIACSAAVVLLTFFWQGFVAAALCLIVIAVFKYISVGSLTMVTVFAPKRMAVRATSTATLPPPTTMTLPWGLSPLSNATSRRKSMPETTPSESSPSTPSFLPPWAPIAM